MWTVKVFPADEAGGLSYELTPGRLLSFGRPDGRKRALQALSDETAELHGYVRDAVEADLIRMKGVAHVDLPDTGEWGSHVTSGVALLVLQSGLSSWKLVAPATTQVTVRTWGLQPVALGGEARELPLQGTLPTTVWVATHGGGDHRLEFTWDRRAGDVAAPDHRRGEGRGTTWPDYDPTELDLRLLAFFYGELFEPLTKWPRFGGRDQRRMKALREAGWKVSRLANQLEQQAAHVVKRTPWFVPVTASVEEQGRWVEALVVNGLVRPKDMEPVVASMQTALDRYDAKVDLWTAEYRCGLEDALTPQAIGADAGSGRPWEQRKRDVLDRVDRLLAFVVAERRDDGLPADPATGQPDLDGLTIAHVHAIAQRGSKVPGDRALGGALLDSVGDVVLRRQRPVVLE